MEHKTRLEATITAWEREQSGLVEQLEARIRTDGQSQGLQGFAGKAFNGLVLAEADYAERRGLIENLDLQVTLTVEDGKKVACESCVVGKKLSMTDPNGNAGDCNKQLPF